MKATIQKGKLQELIQNVINVVPSRTTLQLLSNIFLSAKDGELTLQTTDLDISVSSKTECDISEPGELLVNAAKLREIVRELPEVMIEIDATDTYLSLSYGNTFSCKLPVMSTAEFPKMPKFDSENRIRISCKVAAYMIEKTLFAVSKEETRTSLKGVCWELEDKELCMVATDGQRLGYIRRTNLDGLNISSMRVIVGPKALEQFTNVMGGSDETVEVIFGTSSIAFKGKNYTLYSKLIEGVYPNYEQVIPKGNKNIINVERDSLLASLRRVSILSSEKNRQVRFQISNGNLKISTANSDWDGEAQENLEIKFEGEEISIGFNATLFIEILKLCDCNEVTVSMGTSLSACTLTSQLGSKEEELIFLIMPIRLKEERNEP
ncbi:MAG: DNA polymerase III subunit beta [bacterium]